MSRIDLSKDESLTYNLISENHGVYIMTISGSFSVENNQLESRDAIGIYDTKDFTLKTTEETQLLFIEVPMS